MPGARVSSVEQGAWRISKRSSFLLNQTQWLPLAANRLLIQKHLERRSRDSNPRQFSHCLGDGLWRQSATLAFEHAVEHAG